MSGFLSLFDPSEDMAKLTEKVAKPDVQAT
jgi:hypothetical protein